jgi:hypothetical protein
MPSHCSMRSRTNGGRCVDVAAMAARAVRKMTSRLYRLAPAPCRGRSADAGHHPAATPERKELNSREKKGSPLSDSNRRPPPYHAVVAVTGGNSPQRFALVLALSGRERFAAVCHRLQPRGSIKAPSLVVRVGDTPNSLLWRWCPEQARKLVASQS